MAYHFGVGTYTLRLVRVPMELPDVIEADDPAEVTLGPPSETESRTRFPSGSCSTVLKARLPGSDT